MGGPDCDSALRVVVMNWNQLPLFVRIRKFQNRRAWTISWGYLVVLLIISRESHPRFCWNRTRIEDATITKRAQIESSASKSLQPNIFGHIGHVCLAGIDTAYIAVRVYGHGLLLSNDRWSTLHHRSFQPLLPWGLENFPEDMKCVATKHRENSSALAS